MSEGHLLKPSLARSGKWLRTDGNDFDRWVYCMLVSSVDSWGMTPADEISLKAQLDPRGQEHEAKDFGDAVARLHGCGLVALFTDQDAPWLYVVGHDEQQSRGIRNRKKEPEVPRPEWVLCWAGCDQDPPRRDLDPTTCVLRSARAEVELKGNEVEVEDEGECKGGKKKTSPRSSTVTFAEQLDLLLKEGISEQVARDFLAIRKAKRSPLTPSALTMIKNAVQQAGFTLEDGLKTCCARGWQGLRADWLVKDAPSKSASPPKKDPPPGVPRSAWDADKGKFRQARDAYWGPYPVTKLIQFSTGALPMTTDADREALEAAKGCGAPWFREGT